MRIRPFLTLLLPAMLVMGARGAAAQQASAVSPVRADSAYRAPADTRGAGPNGATLRCRDGSYPAPKAPDSACDGKGGVLVRFPLIPVPARRTDAAPARSLRTLPPGATLATPPAAPTAESRAAERVPAAVPPANATLLCRDGTYIVSDTTAARCAAHGGVRGRFPVRPR